MNEGLTSCCFCGKGFFCTQNLAMLALSSYIPPKKYIFCTGAFFKHFKMGGFLPSYSIYLTRNLFPKDLIMSDEKLECRLAVGAVLRSVYPEGKPCFVFQTRDEGIAEAGKVGLGAGFVNTHEGETLFDGLVRELDHESDGILTKELVMDGLDYKPIYADTVVGWAFKDKRTGSGIAEMDKSHYFFIVDIPWGIAEKLVKAGNKNAEVRNWFTVEAKWGTVRHLDWAEWRNFTTPDVPGDFHQREAALNALGRS